MAEPLEGYHPATHWPTEPDGRPPPRCHWCGYELYGLMRVGRCPECGKDYAPETATKLTPWPPVAEILLKLGWPVLVMLGLAALWVATGASRDTAPFFFGLIGYAGLLVTAWNGYYGVRQLLKHHMPERERTRGMVAALRAAGTLIAWTVIIALLLGILAPVIALGACLFTGGGGFH